MKNYINYICGDEIVAYKTDGTELVLCNPNEEDAVLFNFTEDRFITNYYVKNNKVIIQLANGKTKELENKTDIISTIQERMKIQCLIMEQLVRNKSLAKPLDLLYREYHECLFAMGVDVGFLYLLLNTKMLEVHATIANTNEVISAIELVGLTLLISYAPLITRKISNIELIMDYIKYSFYFQYEDEINEYYKEKYSEVINPYNQVEKENILKLIHMSIKK